MMYDLAPFFGSHGARVCKEVTTPHRSYGFICPLYARQWTDS